MKAVFYGSGSWDEFESYTGELNDTEDIEVLLKEGGLGRLNRVVKHVLPGGRFTIKSNKYQHSLDYNLFCRSL